MFNIIPQPRELLIHSDKKSFKLSNFTTVTKKPYSAEFCDFLNKGFGYSVAQAEKNESIILSSDENIQDDEEYKIESRNGYVRITAKADNGLFYGLQTLKQLLLQGNGKLPDMTVHDSPFCKFRGFMLDSGRYFQTVPEIKRIIDLIALHKFNVFHWHLTEDQGWRPEIKKYPLLTEKGSIRSHTNFDRTPVSGYYSAEDMQEIVKYCYERFIKVIPEFDIPGHTVSAIACYPYLSCFDRRLSVATHWGVKHDILCAGKESTYKFVFDVIDELCEIFTDGYFHIGGDEAVKTRWEICPKCQNIIKENNLSSEEQLQFYFMNKIHSYLKSKDCKTIMWNYFGNENTEMLNRDIMWHFYDDGNNPPKIKEELSNGRKMINAFSKAYYLDFPYSWVNLKTCYDYNPYIDENIIGIDAPLWTEYVPDKKRADYCMFPRLGAIAETAWTAPEDKDFNRFSDAVPNYLKLLDIYNVQYAEQKQYAPSRLRAECQSLYFNRRVIHWQGIHNPLDNLKVKLQVKYSHKNN